MLGSHDGPGESLEPLPQHVLPVHGIRHPIPTILIRQSTPVEEAAALKPADQVLVSSEVRLKHGEKWNPLTTYIFTSQFCFKVIPNPHCIFLEILVLLGQGCVQKPLRWPKLPCHTRIPL